MSQTMQICQTEVDEFRLVPAVGPPKVDELKLVPAVRQRRNVEKKTGMGHAWMVALFCIAICLIAGPATHKNSLADSSIPHNMLLIGNPGTGKSTILNCYLGTRLFESGISPNGIGVTYELDTRQLGNNTYMDTPGLSDTNLRQQAARAINEALRQGGAFKITFVITTEDGRLKPDDLTTMKLVLEAAKQITEDSFAIVVNKCGKDWLRKFRREDFVENLQDQMANRSMPTTSLVHFARQVTALNQQDNGEVCADRWWNPLGLWSVPLDDETVQFLNSVPLIHIDAEQVQDVKYEQFEDLLSQIKEQEEARKLLEAKGKVLEAKAAKEMSMRQQAEKAKDEADRSALAAKTAQQQAEQAKTRAEQAQAEADRRALEAKTAQQRAEQDKGKAEKEKTAANAEATKAKAAHQAAETSRLAAESSLKAAEAQAAAARTAQENAERSRQAAQKAQEKAEREAADSRAAERAARPGWGQIVGTTLGPFTFGLSNLLALAD